MTYSLYLFSAYLIVGVTLTILWLKSWLRWRQIKNNHCHE